MKLKTLETKNQHYKADRWAQLEALAKGGDHFRSHIGVFLPMNPVEPDEIYQVRRKLAHYRSYMGAIINLYSSWLFAADFSVKASERGTKDVITVDGFYGRFQEDVGAETKLTDFMKERFVEALTTGHSLWLIELPSNGGQPPKDAKEYSDRGLGNASLKAIDRCELFDWDEDDKGNLKWALLHTCYDVRESWAEDRDTTVETWRGYDATNVTTYQMTYKKGQRPKEPDYDVPQVGKAEPHGFKRVPLIRMKLAHNICIGEQTFDTQLAHFREDNAKTWLTNRTCYAQPVFNIEDGDRLPTMGAGTAIILGPDDKMGWTSPPTAPFDVLQKGVDAKRDEIYRIVHQMAQAVDNNAETVGRSADSKEIDAAATRIMLHAYGEKVSKFIEQTYELISEARNEKSYEWSIEGFTGYDTATVSSLIANTKEARGLGIPSQTFHKEISTKTALALLPEVDGRVKEAIRAEIHSASFEVSSLTIEEEAIKAKAGLEDAKAAAEPIKAQAAMKTASRPQPKPSPAPTR